MTKFSTFRSISAFALIAALLAGCADIQSSSSAGPGAQPASPADAGRLFAKGCLQTLPNFATIKTALTGEPFTIHSAFGTFYHNQQNLSIKVVDGENRKYCSIVFATTGEVGQVVLQFGAAVNAIAGDLDANVQINEPRPRSDGLTFYNMTTDAQ